jgi:hypothetical protein
MIKCQVSIGEILDKVSILKIKKKRIKQKAKIKNVNHELDILLKEVSQLDSDSDYIKDSISSLVSVNELLWDIIDEIKEKERKQVFDDRFIELARLTYQKNDERFFLKYKINEYFNSDIVEEKNISQ